MLVGLYGGQNQDAKSCDEVFFQDCLDHFDVGFHVKDTSQFWGRMVLT